MTFSVLFFKLIVSQRFNSNSSSSNAFVASLIKMRQTSSAGPESLSKLSSRDAVFTASPMTVYSCRSIAAEATGYKRPVWMPTRMLQAGMFRCFQSALSRSISFSHGQGATDGVAGVLRDLLARCARDGTPKTAMIASPMYFSTTPCFGHHGLGHRLHVFVEPVHQLRGLQPF